ncbi:hypothetical protein SUGI_0007820 [Cryptomeria japonica]|nr:hypothetical protein SUGI_0007820 [Cryptomeria japonica]
MMVLIVPITEYQCGTEETSEEQITISSRLTNLILEVLVIPSCNLDANTFPSFTYLKVNSSHLKELFGLSSWCCNHLFKLRKYQGALSLDLLNQRGCHRRIMFLLFSALILDDITILMWMKSRRLFNQHVLPPQTCCS